MFSLYYPVYFVVYLLVYYVLMFDGDVVLDFFCPLTVAWTDETLDELVVCHETANILIASGYIARAILVGAMFHVFMQE